MRIRLWPDADPMVEAGEIAQFFAAQSRSDSPTLQAAFVCPRPGNRLCGLVEISIHHEAPGCHTDRIGYLEAWYVDPDRRHQGIGRALVTSVEAWARTAGCREMASDTTSHYPLSRKAHLALGYREVEDGLGQDGETTYFFYKELVRDATGPAQGPIRP